MPPSSPSIPQTTHPPLLIPLPQGFNASGIVTIATNLINQVAATGTPTGLILHTEPPGQNRLDIPIDPRVRIFDLTHLPSLDQPQSDLTPFITPYHYAITSLADQSTHPVMVLPNIYADCFGIFAELSATLADRFRVIGFQHSDIAYDTRILCHYQSIINAFVAVSNHIHQRLERAITHRIDDLTHIPYGVAVPTSSPVTPDHANHSSSTSSTLRLCYTGRLEHQQKRILALPHLATQLHTLNINAHITILGDGPAHDQLKAACKNIPTITILGPVQPHQITQHLKQSHALILPSRYEGLSLSILEALANGCIPIVTKTNSGSTQALTHNATGFITDVSPEADEHTAGAALAKTVAQFATLTAAQRHTMAESCWKTAQKHFSTDRHTQQVLDLCTRCTTMPPRIWPANRPCAFGQFDPALGSGSVHPQGPALLKKLLEKLARRRTVVHGTGAHTQQLRDIFLSSPCTICAFTDDDLAKQGSTLFNLPIIAPDHASSTGATDVVISSWMHAQAIYLQRDIYERQGLQVHCIYPPNLAPEAPQDSTLHPPVHPQLQETQASTPTA